MKFADYTFREFVNSDFWEKFGKVNKDGFDYLQSDTSKIVLGSKTRDGEKFDDLISFYYNFTKEIFPPKYTRVAIYSNEQAIEDLSISLVEVDNLIYIMIPEVRCSRNLPRCSEGFFMLLTGAQRDFVEEYSGLNYEDNLDEALKGIRESFIASGVTSQGSKVFLDKENRVVYNENKAAVFETKRAAERAIKKFCEGKERLYSFEVCEMKRTLREKTDMNWSVEVRQTLEDLLDDFDRFAYEIKSGVKGSFTNATSVEELREALMKLSVECVEAANALEEDYDSDIVNYEDMSDEELAFLGYDPDDEAFNSNPVTWDDLKNL